MKHCHQGVCHRQDKWENRLGEIPLILSRCISQRGRFFLYVFVALLCLSVFAFLSIRNIFCKTMTF